MPRDRGPGGPAQELLTVTANPAVDRTLHLPRLVPGAVHRTAEVHLGAGGKGLNVARAARRLGAEVLATAPLGGLSGRLLATLAAAEGLRGEWFWLEGVETRQCLLLTHHSGDATVVNEAGPRLAPEAWESFAGSVRSLARPFAAVALSGSLPPGVPPEALGELAVALRSEGRCVYLDTSGAALRTALREPRGLCVKVNAGELAAALELGTPDGDGLAAAGRELLRRGAALCAVTLGASGALAVAPGGGWRAMAPEVEVRSSVGSGDVFLAGLAVARLLGRGLDGALRLAVAAGAANARSRHPARFRFKEVEVLEREVRLTRIG